jgi:uncharacterized membrane protein YfcA
MTPAAALPKFFVVCSVILLLTGVAQFLVRPRKPKETIAERFINRSTITAVLSVCIGVLGLLFGLGVLPMPKLG